MIRQLAVAENDPISDDIEREMAVIQETRRLRLLEVQQERGLKTDVELCALVGIETGFYSQLKKNKRIGEVLARKIERRIGKPRYWLDGVERSALLTRREEELVQIFRGLTDDRQTLLLGTARQFKKTSDERPHENEEEPEIISVHEDSTPYVNSNGKPGD